MPNTNQTLLAFDFGLRRIGVAVGQTFTRQARPLTTLKVQQGVPQWHEIKALITTWQPNALVVGIPKHMDGTDAEIGEHAKIFAQSLREHFQLPVHEAEERLSTIAARDKIFDEGGYKALKKTEIDSIAAQIILEAWLQQ